MKYCGNCGAPNEEEARFCIKCGNAFNSATAPAGVTGSRPPMYETKIVQVDNSPEVINCSNELWAAFGWSVQNVQVTHSQDTRTYTKNLSDFYLGTRTVETTTINYATITYQRNKNMLNYNRIVQLEKEYENLEAEAYLAKQECEYEDASIGRKIIGAMYPMFSKPYFDRKKEEKKKAEQKAAEYERTGYFERNKMRKKEILEEAMNLL